MQLGWSRLQPVTPSAARTWVFVTLSSPRLPCRALGGAGFSLSIRAQPGRGSSSLYRRQDYLAEPWVGQASACRSERSSDVGLRYSIVANSSPAATVAPSLAGTVSTRPVRLDFISFCIFMASTTTMPWPGSTSSPGGDQHPDHLAGHGARIVCKPATARARPSCGTTGADRAPRFRSGSHRS